MPKIDKLGDIKIKNVIYQKKPLMGWKDESESGRKCIYPKQIPSPDEPIEKWQKNPQKTQTFDDKREHSNAH